ncbi:MAG: adenylate/guanylate cyclase domain-containing protein [Treponema sp.]|nr:adenylate/guanylate cyclase domain-containing protein [Treponema sp.]
MSKKVRDSNHVRFPLGVKLALIIGVLVLVSLGTVTLLNSYFVGQDVRITAENNNLTINTRSASTAENELVAIRANVFQLLDLVNAVSGGRTAALARQAETFFFERNQNIAAVLIVNIGTEDAAGTVDVRMENTRFFSSNELDISAIPTFLMQNARQINRSCTGETTALNASPYFGMGMMALLLPYRENGSEQSCVVLFGTENLSDILGTGSVNTTFMINDNDELLVHPDNERITSGQSMKNHPLVVAMRTSNQNSEESRQIPFTETDENGKRIHALGAFQKLALADIAMLTVVELDTVLEGVRATRRNNLYLTAIVLFVSIILILVFTRFGISRHLRRLTEAAEEIKAGNFDTNLIAMLDTTRRDEIGVLNQSTKDEQEFLNTFARFTNKGVAKAIARKEIDFEPHLKDVTIFFSDIRSFTAISDGFKNRFGDDSPREIINFLNDYMSRMVNCVTLSHGTIDKFEGDAIMAEWGILREDDLSFEQLPDGDAKKAELTLRHKRNVQEDAVNCIRGVIAMRYALMQYNKDAAAFTKAHEGEARAQYKPIIKIGCGINTGRATCGIMGSEDKMEYTAIGDSVNFASRTEASNKACGTDILITEDTYNLLKNDFIRCKENNFTLSHEHENDEIIVEMIPVAFEVKGKGAQHFYGVVNMPRFDIAAFFKPSNPDFAVDNECARAVGEHGPKTLAELRTLLGIPTPEFDSVNLNEEENKVQVKK